MKWVKYAAVVLVWMTVAAGAFCQAAEPAIPVTGILGAMTSEIAFLQDRLEQRNEKTLLGFKFIEGTLKGRKVVIVKCGIGKVNAAITTTLLIDHYEPSEILFTGIAGGINPDLLPGDLVVAASTVYHDCGMLTEAGFDYGGTSNPLTGQRNPKYFPADARLLDLAMNAANKVKLDKIQTSRGERTPRILQGVIATGDVFVARADKKAELRKSLGADAVEMEGAAVAQVCRQLGTPFLAIRSLSDLADANATVDLERFYKIASRNSAELVLALLEQLEAERNQNLQGSRLNE